MASMFAGVPATPFLILVTIAGLASGIVILIALFRRRDRAPR